MVPRRSPGGPIVLGIVTLLSPWALFLVGGLPSAMTLVGPAGGWQALAVGALWVSWVVVCRRAHVLWPLYFTLLLPIAWFVGSQAALTMRHPCWRYSNAAWCGHFCDDDPCTCPARGRGASAYGAGAGCPTP